MRTADQVLSMRIQEGSAGYGVYVMLLELLRDAQDRQLVFNPKHLAFAMNEPDVELVQRVVQDYALFDLAEDGRFSSPWLEAQMREYDEKKRAAVEAGRRGAAKRYGKALPAESGDDSHPMPPPMATQQIPDSNITQLNITNTTNSTKSKLARMSWRDWDGKRLFELARRKEPEIDEISLSVIVGRQTELDAKYGPDKYNLQALADVCAFFHVGVSMFSFLAQYTDNGRVGSPELVRLLEIRRECKRTQFMPKYPAEYLLVKLLEPLQG